MSFLRGACKGPRGHARSSVSGLKLIAAALLVGALWVSTAARAGELDKVCIFDIPAQPLDKALLQFGAQAHVQLSISLGSTKVARITRKLKGSYTGKQALSVLLTGTGLRYAVHGPTVEILQREAMHTGRTATSLGNLHGSILTSAAKPSVDPSQNGNDPPVISDAESHGALREVIVTAQKYNQRAFDVPMSLAVITGTDIERQNITSLDALQYAVPGLIVEGGGVYHNVDLRGIGNIYGNGALVGQYIDEADVTAEGENGTTGRGTGDNALYDLSRVEVLRGPQGTLYGDGSMGGVIRYITNSPRLDGFQMSSDVTSSFTEDGSPGEQIEAMLNTPLVTDTFGLRFAGIAEHDGGWVDQPAVNQKNINSADIVDGRAQALWEPTERLKVAITQILHRDTRGIGYGEDAMGDITQIFGLTIVPHAQENSNISNVTVTYDLQGARLLSSATYLTAHQTVDDAFNVEPFGSLVFWDLDAEESDSNKAYSEELRLSSSGSGAWQWTVGAFYKHFLGQSYIDQYGGLPGPLSSASQSTTFYKNVSSSLAEYANTSYTFDRVTLGAGVRYFKDDVTTSTATVPFEGATFTSTDPRCYLQYGVTSGLNVYASASKGFRSGGFNVALGEPPYKPESVWSYDVGTKFSGLDHRLRADVDVFHSNYSNFVVVGYFAPVYEYANAGDAHIDGIDADLAWRPTERWAFSANTELLHSKFTSIEGLYTGYDVGNRLPDAPTYSFTTSIERFFRVGRRLVDTQLYYYEVSRTQLRSYGSPLGESDVLHFLNFRTELQMESGLRLGVFVHNIMNDRGLLDPFAQITDQSARARPRTFGFDFAVSFQ